MRARWVAALAAGIVLAFPGAGYAAPSMTISDVKVTSGQVDFAAQLKGLPATADLSQASVLVHADGTELLAGQPVTSRGSTSGADLTRGVVVVFDASGSMAEGDALAGARTAAAGYAAQLPADVRLGLVAVAGTPTTLLRPTTDRTAFTEAVSGIRARGDTALYDGIRAAVALLPAGERRVVVLSDGQDTTSRTSLDDVVTMLERKRVPVDVVALGDKIDRPALDQVVKASGGRLIPAGDATALAGAFREAARSFTARLLITAFVPDHLAGRTAQLKVDVVVGTTGMTATVPVTFAKLSQPVTAAPAQRMPTWPRWLIGAVIGAVFGAFLALCRVVLYPLLVGRPRRRRLAQFDRYVTGRPAVAVADAPGAVARTALAWSQQAVRASHHEDRMVHKLDRAGMSLRPEEWLLMQVCVVVTSVAALWLLLPWWAGIPLGVLVGCVGNWGYRRLRTWLRIRRFVEQLPDALQLLVGSLRSGFSLAQALSALVREADDPVAAEIGRALAETRLGANLEDALERVVRRTDSEDLAWAVMAVRIQRDVGGNLADVLQTTVDTMRERGRVRRHVKALSAEGRLSAYILVGLPIGLFGYMYLVRREYVELLYNNAFGIFLLVAAGLLIAVGAFAMSRLVKVEV